MHYASQRLPSTQRVPGAQQVSFPLTLHAAASGQQAGAAFREKGRHWALELEQHSLPLQHCTSLEQQMPPQQVLPEPQSDAFVHLETGVVPACARGNDVASSSYGNVGYRGSLLQDELCAAVITQGKGEDCACKRNAPPLTDGLGYQVQHAWVVPVLVAHICGAQSSAWRTFKHEGWR